MWWSLVLVEGWRGRLERGSFKGVGMKFLRDRDGEGKKQSTIANLERTVETGNWKLETGDWRLEMKHAACVPVVGLGVTPFPNQEWGLCHAVGFSGTLGEKGSR